jgi:hypothetical protein
VQIFGSGFGSKATEPQKASHNAMVQTEVFIEFFNAVYSELS